MTVRVLAPPRLAQMVPPLFADRHLVILTPATANTEWAVQGAWAFARAAATGSRSVLLIDLSADGPMLDSDATGSTPGIADVFLADEPLDDAARPQDRPGLFYIQRGARAGGFESVWASERWAKLARGFASEGALLLLFAPPAALSHFPFEPDGLVVLAPQGYDPADGTFPHIAKRIEQGTALLAVVGDETKRSSGGTRTGASTRPPLRGITAGSRRSAASAGRLRSILAALAGLSAVASAVAIWAGRPSAAAARPRGMAHVAAPADGDATAGDSLFYSVQVAAFNTLEQAMMRAAELESGAAPAFVTPVRMGGGQGTWYRVLTGALPSARAADSLLQALWQSRRIERPQGTILRTPEAYRVGRRAPAADAEADARGLRARGVPAYIVGAPNGTARVYVGAFDLPEQADAVDSLLTAAGLIGTLVQRMGTTP